MSGGDEQALTELIQELEEQLTAFTQDWQVHSLQKSYVGAMVYGALLSLYDGLRFASD